jgi:hypothetical protein
MVHPPLTVDKIRLAIPDPLAQRILKPGEVKETTKL